MVELSIDQAGDGPDAGGVSLSMMTIELGQGLVASQAADGVLDGDPLSRKRGVVDDVLDWPGFLPRLATRREPQAGRMQRRHPDVGQVTQRANVWAQAVEQARGFQQRQIVGRA